MKLIDILSELKLEELGLPASSVMSLNQFVKDDMNEADEFGLGANISDLPPEELQSYLKRQAGEPQVYKTGPMAGQPKLGKRGEPLYKTTPEPTDKYKYPYVHPSYAREIQIVDGENRKYDLNKLKSLITARPSYILKQNEKITHSGGESTQYFNIGLPALQGLAYDEKNNKFVIVNTCPGAGACKVYCYAKKGGYVQWKDASLSQTKLLNFLLNDPEGFKNMLSLEISSAKSKFAKKGAKVAIRWHDAGDFFSPDYMNLAYSIARKFPDVDFYAYTKMADVAKGEKPNNFKMNFSFGAKPEQERQIDIQNIKHSTVVPKQMFTDLMMKDSDDKYIRDEKGRMQFKSPEAESELKRKLASKYGMPTDSVITYDEMKNMPVGNEKYYNVIVRPGDGDESANRADVLGTWLLIH
jgi:hypothetical protein